VTGNYTYPEQTPVSLTWAVCRGRG